VYMELMVFSYLEACLPTSKWQHPCLSSTGRPRNEDSHRSQWHAVVCLLGYALVVDVRRSTFELQDRQQRQTGTYLSRFEARVLGGHCKPAVLLNSIGSVKLR